MRVYVHRFSAVVCLHWTWLELKAYILTLVTSFENTLKLYMAQSLLDKSSVIIISCYYSKLALNFGPDWYIFWVQNIYKNEIWLLSYFIFHVAPPYGWHCYLLLKCIGLLINVVQISTVPWVWTLTLITADLFCSASSYSQTFHLFLIYHIKY